jgi:hypothetical protein
MEYRVFRDRAIAELSTDEDLIAFDGEAPFLQQMRRTAPQWSSLLRLLMADRTVALEVKLGALPVIFDLPPEDLVNFADHLNSLSLLDPKLFRLVMLAAANPYRASGFMTPGMVADTSLIDLDHRSDARAVLRNIARNPAIDRHLLESGQFMAPYASGSPPRIGSTLGRLDRRTYSLAWVEQSDPCRYDDARRSQPEHIVGERHARPD